MMIKSGTAPLALPGGLRDRILEVFEYNQERGEFYRYGRIAGSVHIGYRRIMIDRKRYLAHHLVWLVENHELPAQIDHINRNTDDNRISNLRPANHSQNAANSKARPSLSGQKGVCFRRGAYEARVKKNGVEFYLGRYSDLKEATDAYSRGAAFHHGEYARVR